MRKLTFYLNRKIGRINRTDLAALKGWKIFHAEEADLLLGFCVFRDLLKTMEYPVSKTYPVSVDDDHHWLQEAVRVN